MWASLVSNALPCHGPEGVLAALLQAPALCDGPANAIDPYWTLMCYFNSLRELGRGATLVQADVREYLNAVWHRIGSTADAGGEEAKAHRRFVNNYRELTSRMRSSEIPEVLQELFRESAQGSRRPLLRDEHDPGRPRRQPTEPDDDRGAAEGRLEYIQASSRIGRDRSKPGLVVTNFNPFKPRDRSHFESFRPFHENAYRYVEPTSVTPFSLPVCDRAIPPWR